MPGKKIKIFSCVLILFLSLLLPPLCYAHRVHLFAWVQGDRVHTDSTFPTKKKVVGGMVRVYDPSGAKLLEGKTDEKGAFSFKIPKRTDLRIVLETSMGHRTEFLLPAEEIKDMKEKPLLTDKIKDGDHVSPATLQEDMEQIRKIMEEVIDSRLRPITGKLARLEKERGPRLTDIIGGIGYILGLMGLVLYFKSRRERSNDEISGNG